MPNLIWTTPSGTKSLLPTPFKSEDEFERTVFKTSEVLEDIFLLKRQIRGGGKPGIPDIIGIDNDSNVCIVEMKNCSVDAGIIPQVLQYAIWARANPDSIKAMWLECDNRPDDLVVSWDDMQVRIIVLAPAIQRSTLDLAGTINFPLDLIEVKRWVEGTDVLLLVTKLELEQKTKARTTRGLPIYGEDYYESQYNKHSAKEFIRYANELQTLVHERGWQLELKYNKSYCGFKAGFFNAFGIEWVGSKTFAFFARIGEEAAKGLETKMTRYEPEWKQAVYYIVPGETKTADYARAFELAYKRLTGK